MSDTEPLQDDVHAIELTCGHCERSVEGGSLESLVLEDSFCGYFCYQAAWRERMAPPERRGTLPPGDDGEDDLEMEAPEE